MLEKGDYNFSQDLRRAISDGVSDAVGVTDLTAGQRFELARARLRRAGFDGRCELLRAMHGLCRNLSVSCAMLAVAAFLAMPSDSPNESLLVTGLVAIGATCLLAIRTIAFQRRFAEQIWLDFIALGRPGSESRNP